MSALFEQVKGICAAHNMTISTSVMRRAADRMHELETALNRMVCAHENLSSDTEGQYPRPDTGCIECTVGTVPDRLNTGLCAYHNAKQLLGHT